MNLHKQKTNSDPSLHNVLLARLLILLRLMRLRQWLAIILIAWFLLSSCASNKPAANNPASRPQPQNLFDAYLASDIPIADGFDFAVGDQNGKGSYVDPSTGKRHNGWYIATKFGEQYSLGIHPGEDWNP